MIAQFPVAKWTAWQKSDVGKKKVDVEIYIHKRQINVKTYTKQQIKRMIDVSTGAHAVFIRFGILNLNTVDQLLYDSRVMHNLCSIYVQSFPHNIFNIFEWFQQLNDDFATFFSHPHSLISCCFLRRDSIRNICKNFDDSSYINELRNQPNIDIFPKWWHLYYNRGAYETLDTYTNIAKAFDTKVSLDELCVATHYVVEIGQADSNSFTKIFPNKRGMHCSWR